MICATLSFIRYLPRRIAVILEMIKDPILSKNYYPEEQEKVKIIIFLENILWLFLYQEVNKYYYAYGINRKNVSMFDYLPNGCFKKIRSKSNSAKSMIRDVEINYQLVLRDKFLFGKYLEGLGIPTPKVLAYGNTKKITWFDLGFQLPFSSILERNLDCFIKDPLSDAGNHVIHIICENGKLFSNGKSIDISFLNNIFEDNLLIQDRIEQSAEINKIYDKSVNTIRLVTMNNDGEIFPAFGIMRFGTNNSRIDNWDKGGIACKIDLDTGGLCKYGFFKNGKGTRTLSHPDTGFFFEDFKVPYFKDSSEKAIMLHSFFPGLQQIGWDIAISENGPIFIEGNDDWGLGSVQSTHGGIKKKYYEILKNRSY